MCIRDRYKWKVRPTELKSVKAANGENMIIEGVVNEIFAIGKRNIRVDVYVTSDLNDLILGVDWLGKQGRLVWDFDTQQIRISDGEWLTLQHEKETSCRRIYVESEVIPPPKQESVVPALIDEQVSEMVDHGIIASGQPVGKQRRVSTKEGRIASFLY